MSLPAFLVPSVLAALPLGGGSATPFLDPTFLRCPPLVPIPQEGVPQFPPGSCVLPLPELQVLPRIEITIPWIQLGDPIPSLGLERPIVDPLLLYSDERDLVLLDLPIGGVGDDATFRYLVQRFLLETDPKELCRLAHHLHVQATRRLGTVWVVDGETSARLHDAMKNDPSPLRRALAVVALSKESGSPWPLLLDDRDPLVRAAAARWLKSPLGVTESQAGQVVSVLLELARSDHAATRAVAARAVGPWIHEESQNAELVAIAQRDPDVNVRIAALEGLLAVRSLSARAIARHTALDEAIDPTLCAAVAEALRNTGIALDEDGSAK